MYWSPELKNNTCNDLILTVEVEGSLKYSGEWKGQELGLKEGTFGPFANDIS